MDLQPASTPSTGNDEKPYEVRTQLRGRWLLLARVLWLAIFILTLVVFCANLLVGSYGVLTSILLVAVTSVWFAVSLVLFWRKSDDQAILLFSLLLALTGGVFFPPIPVVLVNYGVWWVPIWVLYVLGAVMLSFGYTFPDGRFIPGFTRWLALGWIAVSLVPISILGAVNHLSNWWLSPVYTLVRIVFYCSLALALLYRYRRRSTPIQRQQLVRGLAIYLLCVLIPLSIGIALLRYRLWEIDIIINRTLVYGTLTGILLAIYLGLIFALQFLLSGIINRNNGVAIVVSTLTIAAIFHPLRRRIQRFIDRRFYRSKYDAAKIIANFSSTLREEVDLNTLSEHLVAVVQETMQRTCFVVVAQI